MTHFNKNKLSLSILLASAVALTACGGGSDSSTPQTKDKTPAEKADFSAFHQSSPVTISASPAGVSTYTFASKFEADKSAVSYTGQTTRHALIDDMSRKFKSYEEGADSTISTDMAVFMDGPNEDVDYVLGKISGKLAEGQTLSPSTTYGSISSGKSIASKVAGEDKAEHITGTFTGWTGASKPLDVITAYIDLLKAEVADGQSPLIPTKNGNVQVDATYIDGKGRDLNQLVQKFMLMAVAFSQGTADYLKTDFASSNSQADGKSYTTAEHKWDEGFGYFGASRNYNSLSDDQIKGDIISDANSDNVIDLTSEVNQGAAVNCAKRDAGSQDSAKTDFTKQAFDAFLTGRKILNDAANANFAATDAANLDAAAKQAAFVWEQCIAATVVHYVNDTNADLQKFIDNNGAFDDLANYKTMAKHWSEMKGFAMGLQFNPESPFHSSTDNQAAFAYMVNELMGDQPDFSSVDNAKAYQKKLLEARGLLQAAYNFDAANVENW